MRARFITINVAGTKDGWFEGRRDLMVEGIARYRPDVVCLQETTLSRGYALYDQARDIGEAIGLPVVAFAPYGNPIEIMSAEQGGIAIISRWPMLRVRNRRLPAAHDAPPDARVALFVVFQAPDGEELKVITTHLSWEPEGAQVRMMQMGLILDDLFQSQPVDPHARLVFTGDFNGTENEPVIHLARECLQDTFREKNPDAQGYTWVTSNPLTGRCPIADRRLDYIFCPTAVKIREAQVILDQEANDRIPSYASDHFGVFAEIEWERPKHRISARPKDSGQK